MVDYCTGPNHINDHVDRAITDRETVRDSRSWESMSNPLHVADSDSPWDTNVDQNGRGVSGKAAMDVWLKAKPILKYVDSMPEAALIEPLDGDYRMAKTGVLVPLNKVGEYLSRGANLEQLLRQTLFDDVHGLNPLAKAWIEFLAENGYDDGIPITHIGTQNMDAEASIWFSTAITGSKYLKEWAQHHTEELGIDSYGGRLAYKIYTMLHEVGHNRGVGGESELGLLLSEFYGKMAKRCKGTDKEEIYRALAKSAAEYAKGHSGMSKFLGYFSAYSNLSRENLSDLVSEYMAQGKSEGYKGKALRDYVAKQLKGKDTKKAKDSKKKQDMGSKDKGETQEDPDDDTEGRDNQDDDTEEGPAGEESCEE